MGSAEALARVQKGELGRTEFEVYVNHLLHYESLVKPCSPWLRPVLVQQQINSCARVDSRPWTCLYHEIRGSRTGTSSLLSLCLLYTFSAHQYPRPLVFAFNLHAR